MNECNLTIVEGPDGAGKTTLVGVLARGIVRSVHCGAYPGEEEITDRYRKAMWPAFVGRGPVVMDRSWLAEPIYGKAFRKGQDRVGPAFARMLERMALSCNVTVVLCLPPLEVAEANFVKRLEEGKEYLTSVEAWRAVYAHYEQLPYETSLPVIRYDYTKTEPWEVQKALLFHRELKNLGPGAGAWRPGQVTLLVGEQLAPGVLGDYPPFFSTDRGGCSHWLAEQLRSLHGVGSEEQLYWVNAKKRDGSWETGNWVMQLAPRRIIALGDVAAQWCQQLGHVYEHCPHPQYWKRFKHGQRYPLLNLLQGEKQ